jgi:methylase of polypeptide subunit release factors
LVNAEAFSVIEETERFDLIISNPPWEDDQPTTIDSYALYDEDFRLLKSLLADLQDHLKPGGRALLAYGCVSAIRAAKRLADEHSLELRILDDRDLESLPETFLPGMLLEVRPRDLDRAP